MVTDQLALMRKMWENMDNGRSLVEALNRDLDVNLPDLTYGEALPFIEKVIEWTQNEAIYVALYYSRDYMETQPIIVMTDYLGFFYKETQKYFKRLADTKRKNSA